MRTIKDMPEHSRPREKLRDQGVSALTDAGLVATIRGLRVLDHLIVTKKGRYSFLETGLIQ